MLWFLKMCDILRGRQSDYWPIKNPWMDAEIATLSRTDILTSPEGMLWICWGTQ